eukprot:c18954_g1_i1.p1 GENE.c18954_g1_i1~~c18954_g1_i1.p1  ORF type:complete len:656 (+),score=318.45 c18954_g1_i1:1105-3072(+)
MLRLIAAKPKLFYPPMGTLRRSVTLAHVKRTIRLGLNANNNPDDAVSQATFLKELNEVNPHEVIARVQSKKYATNDEVTKEYMKALGATNNLQISHVSEILDAVKGVEPTSPPLSPVFGLSPSHPLKLQLPKPSAQDEIYNTLRALFLTFLFVTGATYAFDLLQSTQAKNGQKDREYHPQKSTKRFSDVKGCDEAVDELKQVVSYLKDSSSFTKLGGKLPKGILLTGSPGTGKTLLAKAVAGEANVSFFYASGSEFEEVYVGVGARRMRNLFESAKKNSPCIIFIDEIDAVGGKRDPRDSHSSKMTLNQMLVEMDGFEGNTGIIVIGATNFPDLLDPALKRGGRFDLHVNVSPPDAKGREQILDLYLKGIKTQQSQTDNLIKTLAKGTPGFTGAEIENLVNMASIRATTRGSDFVDLDDLEFAREKILMGPEKKKYKTTENGRKCTAHHEAGHALVAALTKGADPIYKATILPRGQALGMVQQLPDGDQYSFSLEMMKARLDVMMAGRVAEELLLGTQDYTSGASSDLNQATALSKAMVMQWGMSKRAGPVYYGDSEQEQHLSPETKRMLDDEVQSLLQQSYNRAKSLILSKREEHLAIANALLEQDTLTGEEIINLINKKPSNSSLFSKSKQSAQQASTNTITPPTPESTLAHT